MAIESSPYFTSKKLTWYAKGWNAALAGKPIPDVPEDAPHRVTKMRSMSDGHVEAKSYADTNGLVPPVEKDLLIVPRMKK